MRALKVSFFNQQSQVFEPCFSLQVDLEFEGIFLMSASSGFKDPDHHYVHSFKAWDASAEVLNTRFQDSHARKASTEHMAEKLGEAGADYITQKQASLHGLSQAELLEMIGREDYQIHKQFVKAEENLA